MSENVEELKELLKGFSNFTERVLFEILPRELSKYVGEGAAAALIFNIVKEGMKTTLAEELKKMIKIKNLKDALLACYTPYEKVGMPFKYEVVKENGDVDVIVRVYECPHYKYTKDFPRACIACAATKAGIIEDLLGEKVRVNFKGERMYGSKDATIEVLVRSHKPSGDPYCEFEVRRVSDITSQR